MHQARPAIIQTTMNQSRTTHIDQQTYANLLEVVTSPTGV
jgi:hypothetical protein